MGGVNHRHRSSNRIPRTTPKQRAQWVRRYRRSGLTQRIFAAQHGIGWSTLVRWLRDPATAAVDPPAPPCLHEVPLSSLLGTSPWAAEITFAEGTTLRLASALAGSLLQPWLSARP